MRRVAAVVAVVVVLVPSAAAGAATAVASGPPAVPSAVEGPVVYRPPVAGPVVDPFRPPPHPGAPGNRGVDYETASGQPVGAAADGEVVFAGQVGGSLHVVVLHGDGVRTSYSFLHSIAVHRGDRVVQGQVVGTSGARLHFGARVGDTYIDPARLFVTGPPRVHLVPDDERRPATEARERSGLLAGLRGLAGSIASSTADAVAWARDRAAAAPGAAAGQAWARLNAEIEELRGLLTYVRDTNPWVIAARHARTIADWYVQRGHCTPAEVTPPPLRAGEHLAVRVGGFGSSDDRSGVIDPGKGVAIDHVDTASLGYRPEDVVRFSYNGGTIDEHGYDPPVTAQDIRISARRLRQLLERLGEQHPGTPIDILAHSQGGVVARQALAMEADPGDHRLPRITSLVLLGVPNSGTDLATGSAMLGHTRSGAVAEDLVGAAIPDEADIGGVSISQLAETSTLLARLNRTPPPASVHVTSIGARTDPVVPARHTRLTGADNIVVDSGGGISTHDELPGSAPALREVNLAVHGLPPTCQSLPDMLTDTTVSEGLSLAGDTVGVGAWAAGRWVDSISPPLASGPVPYVRRNP